jgi:hypothetical protein
MPWPYLILTFIFAVPTGFALFSQGAFFHSAAGQVIQGILSMICFGFIGWAFWQYGWKIGLLEVFVIFVGSNVGLSILMNMQRRM